MPQDKQNQARLIPRQNVDIYTYPSLDQISQHPKGSWVTLGDLHGNAAKFINLLIQEGIAEVPPEIFETLIENYQISDTAMVTKEYFPLDQVTLKKPCPNLRLIGDDFADRGKNDLLIAFIYQFLDNQKDFRFEVLASNHGIEFLRQYAYGLNPPDGEQLKLHYRSDVLDVNGQPQDYSSFGRSYHNLRKYFQWEAITVEEVNELIHKHYLPHLKLLSCEINNDNEVTLYSHAPIKNLDLIQALAEKVFDTPFAANTPQQLKETIEKLNEKFQEIVLDREKLHQFFEENQSNPIKNEIFSDFLNNRYSDITNSIEHSQTPPPYKIINVHGHVGEATLQQESKYISHVNVDSHLGINDQKNEHHYHAYISPSSRPKLSLFVLPPPPPIPQPHSALSKTAEIMRGMHLQVHPTGSISSPKIYRAPNQTGHQTATAKIENLKKLIRNDNQEKPVESNTPENSNPSRKKASGF